VKSINKDEGRVVQGGNFLLFFELCLTLVLDGSPTPIVIVDVTSVGWVFDFVNIYRFQFLGYFIM
jgi:hypothetical protein